MFRAIWNGVVLAESSDTVRLEGNRYFPVESLRREHFTDSATTSTCPWKGQARYFHIRAGTKTNPDAAWYYPKPSPAASAIAGHVAFWHGVRVERVPESGGERPGRAGAGGARRLLSQLRRTREPS